MEWRIIPGYSRYKVSEYGEIMNEKKVILTKNLNHKGYYRVNIIPDDDSWSKQPFVHRLVAQSFLKNPNNLPQVNHLDSDKVNNMVSNLQWCDNLQNFQHSWDNRTSAIFNKNSNHRVLSREEILEIRNSKVGMGDRKLLCEKFGISLHVVKDIRSGRSWAHIQ